MQVVVEAAYGEQASSAIKHAPPDMVPHDIAHSRAAYLARLIALTERSNPAARLPM